MFYLTCVRSLLFTDLFILTKFITTQWLRDTLDMEVDRKPITLTYRLRNKQTQLELFTETKRYKTDRQTYYTNVHNRARWHFHSDVLI